MVFVWLSEGNLGGRDALNCLGSLQIKTIISYYFQMTCNRNVSVKFSPLENWTCVWNESIMVSFTSSSMESIYDLYDGSCTITLLLLFDWLYYLKKNVTIRISVIRNYKLTLLRTSTACCQLIPMLSFLGSSKLWFISKKPRSKPLRKGLRRQFSALLLLSKGHVISVNEFSANCFR